MAFLGKLTQATVSGKSDKLFTFMAINNPEEDFSLGMLKSDKSDLKVTLAQIQVNALNYWMDKLRTLSSSQCESALLALPEKWFFPSICRTDADMAPS